MTPDPSDAEQFDYPVTLPGSHSVAETNNYDGDTFECQSIGAYMHTGAWPTWSYCPFCGGEL